MVFQDGEKGVSRQAGSWLLNFELLQEGGKIGML